MNITQYNQYTNYAINQYPKISQVYMHALVLLLKLLYMYTSFVITQTHVLVPVRHIITHKFDKGAPGSESSGNFQ